MTRKKVKLAFISNDSARKATLKKRRKGMIKKVEELSTLCGIDACAVIYSPYESEPEVWPSPSGAERVISQFKRMPEMEQSKKMVNQESFLRQRIQKVKEQVKKLQKENRENEMTHVMHQTLFGKPHLAHLNFMDLTDLHWIIDKSIKDIHYRIEALKKGAPPPCISRNSQQEGEQEKLPLAAEASPPPPVLLLDSNADSNSSTTQRQWLVDLMNSGPQQHIGNNTSTMSFGDQQYHHDDNYNHHNVTAGGTTWSNAFFPWDK